MMKASHDWTLRMAGTEANLGPLKSFWCTMRTLRGKRPESAGGSRRVKEGQALSRRVKERQGGSRSLLKHALETTTLQVCLQGNKWKNYPTGLCLNNLYPYLSTALAALPSLLVVNQGRNPYGSLKWQGWRWPEERRAQDQTNASWRDISWHV